VWGGVCAAGSHAGHSSHYLRSYSLSALHFFALPLALTYRHTHPHSPHSPHWTPRFVNSDPGHVHKDIRLVLGDGKEAVKLDDKTAIGCDADFRYWEGRDDVSVYNHSAARVRFSQGRVSLWIDAKASGNWVSCFEGAALTAPEGWYREGAWLGLTASTGELADNHDLLSLITIPEDEVALKNWLEPRPELLLSGNEDVDRAIRSAVTFETWEIKDRLAFLEHKIEHECVCVCVYLGELQQSTTPPP
jgi:hypothetical protein